MSKYSKILTKEFLEREYIEKKKPSPQIARETGCSHVTILKYLRIRSLRPRNATECKLKGINSPSSKYKINENYFKTIDTREKAYWLGFLTADAGMIYDKHRLQLDLAIKDENHVLKFRKALKSNHKLFYTLHSKKYKSVMLSITNRELFDDLSKVFTRKNIPSIDQRFISHFLRGVFDGDGCVMYFKNSKMKARVSLLGTFSFLEDLKTKLIFPCDKKVPDVGGIFELRLEGRFAFKFMDWIYTESTDKTRLTRKFEKYHQILKLKKKQGYLTKFTNI